MKKNILIILIAFASIYPQETFKKTGTSGFVFLEIPAAARTAALGEASISLDDMNSEAIFVNPAALGFSNQEHSLSFSYSPWFADIKNYAAGYSIQTPVGVFGLGAIMFDYGTMPKTSKVSGQRIYEISGDFSANALALSMGYSKMLTDHFSFGVAFKYVREKIDIYSASNILFDGGILYNTGLSSLRLAATIQNFGVDTKYRNDRFKMPALLRIGAAAEVMGNQESEYRLTTTLEVVHASDSDERLNIGAEAAWNNILCLRGGYKFFYDEDGFSFGVGLNPKLEVPVLFDFSFSDYGRLGNILRFTLQLGML